MTEPVWAIIPLKEPDQAKSRLAAILAPEARRRLFFLMARQVIRAARAAKGITNVAVVTASGAVARFAEAEGARVLPDDAQAGFAEACREGLRVLAREGVRRALILPGDLPLASAEEISKLTLSAKEGRVVGIVPDRRRDGTNALLLQPLDVIPLAFGPGSYAAHAKAAQAAGAHLVTSISVPLGLDIDSAADLDELRGWATENAALRDVFRETDLPPSDE